MLSSLYTSMCEALKFSFCTRSKGGGGGARVSGPQALSHPPAQLQPPGQPGLQGLRHGAESNLLGWAWARGHEGL